MAHTSNPASAQNDAPTPNANTSEPSLRERLIARGWKDNTSEMRGKAIVIVGATHLKKHSPKQRPLGWAWDEENIQDWLRLHPGLTREKLLAELEYFGGAVADSVSSTSTIPPKK